jgi:hypothetical protein
MVQIGTYAELLGSSVSFARLLEDINQHKKKKEQEQEQQPTGLSHQVSKIGSICSEKEDEEDVNSLPNNAETKQEGTVKWNVHLSYLRAGAGLVSGLLVIVIVFSAQQATSIYSNWWLAGWSNDETHRNRVLNNCSNVRDNKINEIRSMNEIEWNTYRDRKFYTFCGWS